MLGGKRMHHFVEIIILLVIVLASGGLVGAMVEMVKKMNRK